MSAIRMSNALLPRRMGLAHTRSCLCATIKRKDPNEITCRQSGAVGMVLPVNEFILMPGTQFPPAGVARPAASSFALHRPLRDFAHTRGDGEQPNRTRRFRGASLARMRALSRAACIAAPRPQYPLRRVIS